MSDAPVLTAQQRSVINGLQGGFPITDRPFEDAAKQLGLTEDELIACLRALKEQCAISRFAPLFNAERLGGAVTLAALAVPQERFDEVAAMVNQHREVAHNYARTHELNMWFVVACEAPDDVARVLASIESETGCTVFDFPKTDEFFIEFKVSV